MFRCSTMDIARADVTKRDVEAWLVERYGADHGHTVQRLMRPGQVLVQVRLRKGAQEVELAPNAGVYDSGVTEVQVRTWLEAAKEAKAQLQQLLAERSIAYRTLAITDGIRVGVSSNVVAEVTQRLPVTVEGFPVQVEAADSAVAYDVIGVARPLP